MNYQKKYESSQNHIQELRKTIEEKDKKIFELEGELEYWKNFNTESGKKAKALMAEIESLRTQLTNCVNETEEIKAKYQKVVEGMKKMERAYKKKFREIIAEAKKDL